MDKALNKDLYMKAKEKADRKFKEKTSAYKSMYIVAEYERMGGKFKGKKNGKLSKWREEKWIQVVPFLENGERIPCGSGADKKSCRPTKIIDKNTPLTINQLIKMHGKEKLLKFAKEKKKNMGKRADWKNLKLR